MAKKFQIVISTAETTKVLDITPQVLEIADQPRNDLSLEVIAECLLEDFTEAYPDADVTSKEIEE